MKSFNKKLGDMKSKLYSMQRELFEMVGSDKYDLTTNSIKIDEKVGFSMIFETKKSCKEVQGSLDFLEEKMNLLTSVLNMLDEFYYVGTKVNLFDLYMNIVEFRDPRSNPSRQIFTNRTKAIELVSDIREKYSNANYVGETYKLFKYNKETGMFDEVVL